MTIKVRPAVFVRELLNGIMRVMGLLFLLSLSALPLRAQTNAPRPALPANRYLFIVETSRAMQRRADGVLQVMEDLIGSGISGQLHRGDTIALWTYNADLYAGRFPLQQWTPDTQKTVAVRILSFLKQQPYEKQAFLQKALMTMDKVIKNSDFITVILISNGDQLMQGTPFDEQINNLYKLWDKEQQKARMPFVTVLRAAKGKITHFSVTSAPWPVDMPPLPSELLMAATNSATKPVVASKTNSAPPAVTKKPAPPMGQPLIISGKKPQVAQAPTPADSVATNQQQLVTNAPRLITRSEAAAPAAPTEDPAVSRPLTMITQSPAPVTISEQARTQVPAAAPDQTAVLSQQPPLVSLDQKVRAQRTEDGGLKSVEPKVAKLAPSSASPEASSSTNGIAATILETSTNSPALTRAVSPQSRAVPPTSAVSPESAVVPPEPVLARKSIWIAGLAFGVVALALIMLMMRRARASASSSSSLITRSLERERKP